MRGVALVARALLPSSMFGAGVLLEAMLPNDAAVLLEAMLPNDAAEAALAARTCSTTCQGDADATESLDHSLVSALPMIPRAAGASYRIPQGTGNR